MIKAILKFRYLFIVAIVFLMVNSIVFLLVGVKECLQGYAAFLNTGFTVTETERPGMFLLEALDFFMIALVFMIFALGMGRLFLFDSIADQQLPGWLRINSLSQLKHLLWETILLTMVIFCITHIARSDIKSVDLLVFPGIILILSLSLFLVRWHKSKTN